MTKKISRRSFIKKTIATAAITGISSILLTQQAPANITINKKPNILFILNDQERAWPFIQNNIDLPARRYLESISTYFNRSYTTTPICSPARSSVYTGQHVQFTGVWDNTVVPWTPGLYENVNTIGHLLTNENYETGYFGKWHLSNITESNTNENALGFDGMKKMFKKYGFYNSNQKGERDLAHGGYEYDGMTALDASMFIHDKKKAEKPWAAFVNFVNPHDIMFYKVAKDIKGTGFVGEEQKFAPNDPLYQVKHEIEFPKNFGPRPWDQEFDPLLIMNTIFGEIPYDRIDLWVRFCNYYFNCLRDVDRHMAYVLQSLKKTNQFDNTIIFLISDHGEMLGQHGARDKVVPWEESIRVPTLVYHPDLKKQQTCNSLISNIDIVPTLLEFTGVDTIKIKSSFPELKGNSFAQLTENINNYNIRDKEGHLIQGCAIIPSVFFVAEKFRHVGLADSYIDKIKAFLNEGTFLPNFDPPLNYKGIVDKRFKLIRNFSPNKNSTPTTINELFTSSPNVELYDLKEDPFELNNLAYVTDKQNLLLEMNTKLNNLIDKEIGLENQVLHLPGPDWFWTL